MDPKSKQILPLYNLFVYLGLKFDDNELIEWFFQSSPTRTNFSLNFLDSYDANSSIFSLLGFGKKNYSGTHIHIGNNRVKLRTPFIDVVIPEVPYMACKKNPHSKRIIERVSLASESNQYIFPSPEDYSETNYFTPINLDRITIQLFDEHGIIPYNARDDNFFEFEIITLNNIDIL